MKATEENTCHFKVVLLGHVGVGKTSLAVNFAKGKFHKHVETTIGGIYVFVMLFNCDFSTSYIGGTYIVFKHFSNLCEPCGAI